MLSLKEKSQLGRRIRLALLLLPITALLVPPVLCTAEENGRVTPVQCPRKPLKASKAKHMAGDFFGRAERAFDKKHYAKALRRFLCSLYVIEHEATLTNIEQVIQEVENKKLVALLLRSYVELNPEGEMTGRIEEMAAEIEKEFGIRQEDEAESEPPTEEEAVPKSAPAPVDEPVCVSTPDAAPFVALAEKSDRAMKGFGIGNLGAGAAFIVAGALLQGFSLRARNKADEATSYDEFLHQIEVKKQFQIGAMAGFAAGAVTAGIGVAQFVIWKKRHKTLSQLKSDMPMTEKCDPPKEADSNTVEPEAAVGLGEVRFSLRF